MEDGGSDAGVCEIASDKKELPYLATEKKRRLAGPLCSFRLRPCSRDHCDIHSQG